MQSNLEATKRQLKLLSALVEMRNLEALLASESPKVSEQIDFLPAKETFNRWAQDSETHRKACQDMIEKLQDKVRQTKAGSTVELNFGSPHVEKDIFAMFPELKEDKLAMRILYALVQKHLTIEGDAERRYAEMVEMTDDQKIKNTLLDLSKCEKRHHTEAQTLIDALKKMLANKM